MNVSSVRRISEEPHGFLSLKFWWKSTLDQNLLRIISKGYAVWLVFLLEETSLNIIRNQLNFRTLSVDVTPRNFHMSAAGCLRWWSIFKDWDGTLSNLINLCSNFSDLGMVMTITLNYTNEGAVSAIIWLRKGILLLVWCFLRFVLLSDSIISLGNLF